MKMSESGHEKGRRSNSPPRVAKKDIAENKTPLVSNTTGRRIEAGSTPQKEKDVQLQIEELDRHGKKLFKEKKASTFWTCAIYMQKNFMIVTCMTHLLV